MNNTLSDKERIQKRKHYIELLRNNGFNCFPLKELAKIADSRYKASRTELNQTILDDENFGYIPIRGHKTAIIDFDDKEKFRHFAKENIDKGYMVIETPHGWHIPIKNLSGEISKIELFDYSLSNDKMLEIQGPDQYCVGPCSLVYDDDKPHEELLVTYESIGTDTICDARGTDFHNFVDNLCRGLKLEPRKKTSRSSYKNYRERFKQGLPPTKGSSNDYFFQAAIQCKLDGLTENEALEKVKTVYDRWFESDAYSGRPWSNIEAKIQDAYSKELHPEGGRPSNKSYNTADLALSFVNTRQMYSDDETHDIFENKVGYIERINNSLKRELQKLYPEMVKEDYNDILFKIEGLAPPLPPTNKNLVVFNNGVYDRVTKKIIETNDIADMGFKEYAYLEPNEENFPAKFHEIMFGNVDKSEHNRIKAGLKSIFSNRLDPKMSVIYGESGVGKSTGLTILATILKDYSLVVELDQLLNDRFIRAKIKGVRLLIFQDLPKDWKDFTQIKTLTGEAMRTERGFMQDATSFENKIKIWGSGNYLTKIPEHEKNAMYTRRLSLIHNTRKQAYPENPGLIDEIVKSEGEKIISWILNLPDEDCIYESEYEVRTEWEKIASPEIQYLEDHYEITEEDNKKVTVYAIVKHFRETMKLPMDLDVMNKALQAQGYIVYYNIAKNIRPKAPEPDSKQSNLGVKGIESP